MTNHLKQAQDAIAAGKPIPEAAGVHLVEALEALSPLIGKSAISRRDLYLRQAAATLPESSTNQKIKILRRDIAWLENHLWRRKMRGDPPLVWPDEGWSETRKCLFMAAQCRELPTARSEFYKILGVSAQSDKNAETM